MAVASSQVGQVHFSAFMWVWQPLLMTNSVILGVKDHTFMCPPDHSTTICYGLGQDIQVCTRHMQSILIELAALCWHSSGGNVCT